jgi:hypothetical protein
MNGVNLDWRAIRPINGSRSDGFEELVCQLARVERPEGTSFVRTGNPDAGVECSETFNDGREWGWQAKYFDALGKSQWGQIDVSVKTALDKHPRLVRYCVCVPLDRADARIEGQTSAQDRWDQRVEKWSEWARDRGMAVELVYWGSHELIERLSRPEHVGRLRFWFDTRGFDRAWFNARLDEAITTAGPRYTPEVHVDLPIASKFEAFGRTGRFFDGLKALARPVREKLGWIDRDDAATDSTRATETRSQDGAREADELGERVRDVVKATTRVLLSLREVFPTPTGSLPFRQLADEVGTALEAAGALEVELREWEHLFDERQAKEKGETTPEYSAANPFRERLHQLWDLAAELRSAKDAIADADAFAGTSLLLLTGEAGTGKTHLLCDIAKARLADGRPTVLLMGQQFLSAEAPWTQALQNLDLSDLRAEEFVGALEAAAQVAGCRALVLIDALNEGAGRKIWPDHLAAFLAHLERSAWISVGLAVRSSYEPIVIPGGVRERAVEVEHRGFDDQEYEAARAFFDHYEIERPSAPLLVPEYRNPLFLKVLCRGLRKSGQRRLPRGFRGISDTFNLFLAAVNGRLAEELGFNVRRPLVRHAVEALVARFVERSEHWLDLEEAEELINGFLPGREHARSLYAGLVSEGVLFEVGVWREGEDSHEVVQIAYERLTDHLVAKHLLDLHLDPEHPKLAFEEEGPLAFVANTDGNASSGLLEALCVQVAERTGEELVNLAPSCEGHRAFPQAFRQSVVWRSPDACSDATREVLDRLNRLDRDLFATLDVFLTLATVPDHPLNARFLHDRLTREAMSARDAWWNIYLHHAWGDRGPVDRLVEWAWSVTSSDVIEDETLVLAARTLAWMFSTSNRFLRDRATKALVSLLTGRLPAVSHLIEDFAGVDDPYVSERVYAVAYGCAMRSHDAEEVGRLAQVVYDRVFKSGTPPPHILLRDYARGVVERALYLGSPVVVDPEMIRPLHRSEWPHIPTEEEIKALMPEPGRGSYDSGDVEWARNTIKFSVFMGDFARYIIGTNSGATNWLSLGLDEATWASPDERLALLSEKFSDQEKAALEEYEAANRATIVQQMLSVTAVADEDEAESGRDETDERDAHRREAERARKDADDRLFAAIVSEHAPALRVILDSRSDLRGGGAPYFDLRLIQRYVFWRVFDLGWTVGRFGHFDRFEVRDHARDAAKAERMGKKYQWIAYHEIVALIADHFQYHERFGGSGEGSAYEGPWQDSFRNVDPSCTLRDIVGGTSWEGHSPSWWAPSTYDEWEQGTDHGDWVRRTNNLPPVERMLVATHPEDGSVWLNLNGYLNWKQAAPPESDPYEVDRREIWYISYGYLLRACDAEGFLAWAETVDLWGRWMPSPRASHELFLGEYVWSPAARFFECPYYGYDGWTQPGNDCPAKLCVASSEYFAESRGFDCSVDDGYTLHLPSSELIRLLGLRWNGSGADYVDAEDRLSACDPSAHSMGPGVLLVRQDSLVRALQQEGLTICWAVTGQKQVLLPMRDEVGRVPTLRMSGAYVLKENGLSGFLNCMFEDGSRGNYGSPPRPTVTLRTSP